MHVEIEDCSCGRPMAALDASTEEDCPFVRTLIGCAKCSLSRTECICTPMLNPKVVTGRRIDLSLEVLMAYATDALIEASEFWPPSTSIFEAAMRRRLGQ